MTQDEGRELRRLASQELASLPRGIGEVHRAISSRVFRALGPSAAPIRVWHNAVADASYGVVSGGLRVVGLATPEPSPAVIGALNGLIGDRLEAEGSPLAIEMAVRRIGEPRTDRIAVFLHGLGETEYAWGSPSYGDRLFEELGITPVFVRFNTGRHISENGASLARLLEEFADASSIALIGHSMGGLVLRSACHHGGSWTRRSRTRCPWARRTWARRWSRPSTR